MYYIGACWATYINSHIGESAMTQKKKSTKRKLKNNKKRRLVKKSGTSSPKVKLSLKEISESLRSAKQDFTKGLLQLAKINDWNKLGYSSLKNFIEKEHPELEYAAVLATLNAAITEQRLFGTKSIGMYSMNAMRSLKHLDDSQIKEFKKLAQDKWKDEGNSEIRISPKWLTRTKVEELKASLLLQHDKATSAKSGINKDASSNKKSVKKKDLDRPAKKLTRALKDYNEDTDFLKFLMDFLAKELRSSHGEDLLEKVKKELKISIERVRSNRKIKKKGGRK